MFESACFMALNLFRFFCCLLRVSLKVSPSEDGKCPNQPVTARCRVRKPADSSTHLLLWQCDGTNERIILCNNNSALELACRFGILYDIKSTCIW